MRKYPRNKGKYADVDLINRKCEWCNAPIDLKYKSSRKFCPEKCQYESKNFRSNCDAYWRARRYVGDIVARRWMKGKTTDQIVRQVRFIRSNGGTV